MNVWFQSADFTATDAVISPDMLKARFMAHPWSAELERQRQLEAGGVESCDPGCGIGSEDGRILHLCPRPDSTVYCHYHYRPTRKLLGFFTLSGRQELLSWSEPSLKSAT
jgi:hypothetical protein